MGKVLPVRHGIHGKLLRHFHADIGSSCMNLADGDQQISASAFLGYVSMRTEPDSTRRILIFVVHGEHENCDIGCFLLDLFDQVHTAATRHR